MRSHVDDSVPSRTGLRRAWATSWSLIGLHGSLTDDEMLIPLLVDAGR